MPPYLQETIEHQGTLCGGDIFVAFVHTPSRLVCKCST